MQRCRGAGRSGGTRIARRSLQEGYRASTGAASFGSRSYANYMVDAGPTLTRNLGIDGYCEDVSANYGCMLQTQGRGSMPY